MYNGRCNRCLQCPNCSCVLVPTSVDLLTHNNTTKATGTSGSYALHCSNCDYDSRACSLMDTDKESLEMSVLARERESVCEEAFKQLISGYLHSAAQASSHSHNSRLYKHTPTPSLAVGGILSPAPVAPGAILSPVGLGQNPSREWDGPVEIFQLPQRMPLLTRRTVRSRADTQANKLSILLTPKPNPLEGDSGNRAMSRGWFVKDLSAVNLFPFVTVCACQSISPPQNQETRAGMDETELCAVKLQIKVSNPIVDHAVDVIIRYAEPPYLRERFPAFDEKRLSIYVCSPFSNAVSGADSQPRELTVCLDAYEDEYLRDEPVAHAKAPSLTPALTPPPAIDTPTPLDADANNVPWHVVTTHYHNATLSVPLFVSKHPQERRQNDTAVFALPLVLEVYERAERGRGKLICGGSMQICIPQFSFV
jgi:hypothetical protein